METQFLRSRNARMQKCRKMFIFCAFAFLKFCFVSSILAQNYGDIQTFMDSRDGQTYKKVLMPDNKWWMAENLKYRKGLNNPIFSNNTTANTFVASKNTYYCPGPGPLNTSVNQADPLACEYWGALYPFWVAYANSTNTAVNTTLGEQGICPTGWHLPTDNEWNLLFTKMGGTTNAGKLLKDTTRRTFSNNQAWKKYWTNSALQNDNTYGFSALAAGLRTTAGAYSGNGTQALFWTSTPNANGTQASSKIFIHNSNLETSTSTQNRADALSVRCVEGDCNEEFKIQFARASCNFSTQTYATIDYTTSKKSIPYELSVPSTSGTWTFSLIMKNNTLSTAPTFVISNNNTSNAFVTLNFSSLLPTDNGETFTLSATATNSTYCVIEQDFIFTMQDVSSLNALTTITGSETTGNIRQITDPRDGKTYEIILMADNKWWMRENLNYQTGLSFRSTPSNPFTTTTNGVPGIGSFWCPGVSNTSTATTLTECATWGALYTWEAAVSTDGVGTWSEPASSQIFTNAASGNPTSACSRGICPPGWHVPSDREWGDMLNAVETGTKNHNTFTGWSGTNAAASLKSSPFNSSVKQSIGFSLLSAGCRNYNGLIFNIRGSHAYLWSSSGCITSAWYRSSDNSISTVYRGNITLSYGFSVRCQMD